jgi:hypothetical protein
MCSYLIEKKVTVNMHWLFIRISCEKELNVWWDKRNLSYGEPWEVNFRKGLVNSATFICLLSREALNSQSSQRRNVSLLKPDSDIDYVVLEMRVMTELMIRGSGENTSNLYRRQGYCYFEIFRLFKI